MAVELLTTEGAGTWIVPAGVTSVQVECWGAGGGRNPAWSSYAGGGGAYSKVNSMGVTPGASVSYSIGLVGNNTRHGGDTWFLSTSAALAKGGKTSYGSNDGTTNYIGAGGLASAGVGDVKYSGGSGQGSFSSGGGASASPSGNGGNGIYQGSPGAGGSSPGAGAGGASGNNNGVSNVEGGGGGGGGGSGTGGMGGVPGGGAGGGNLNGIGGRGQIRLTYSSAAPSDTTAPTITSATSMSVAENTANPTGTLTANETVTWSKNGGADAALFSLTGSTWTLNATPDYETKTSYAVVWRATDTAGNTTDQTFTLNITDVSETAPGGGTGGGEQVVLFTTGYGDWTVPAGVTSIKVECWGGGGGSDDASSNAGGGGAYARVNALAVTPGQSLPWSVGAGGTATSPGSASIFGNPAAPSVAAPGGCNINWTGQFTLTGGGTFNDYQHIGEVKYKGGNVAAWQINGGASASPTGNGGDSTGSAGGSSPNAGAGGIPGNTTTATGQSHPDGGGGGYGAYGYAGEAGAPGGGAGASGPGAVTTYTGGRGQIRITYTTAGDGGTTPTRKAPRSTSWL